jgi:predicted Mrr-cat superfamily restriction endonuclease
MNLIDEFLKVYEKLPDDIQAEIPLKRIWTIVPDLDE